MPATDDEIREKYLERAIRELNLLTRDIQDCSALPARRADARARLRPPAGRHHAAQVRAAAVGDRGGRRLLRPLGERADEVAAAPADRSARRLRDAVRQVPGRRHLARRSRPASPASPRRSRSSRRRSSSRWATTRSTRSNDLDLPLAAAARIPTIGEVQRVHAADLARCTSRTSIARSTRSAPSARSGPSFRVLGDWYAELPPY